MRLPERADSNHNGCRSAAPGCRSDRTSRASSCWWDWSSNTALSEWINAPLADRGLTGREWRAC